MNSSHWLNFTQHFLHNKFPRYSIYSFRKANSTFVIDDPLYLEGVLNYSIIYVLLLLISLLLVIGTVLLIHLNIVRYSFVNVAIYKTMIAVFGFLAFLCSIMGFVGFTMISSSLTSIIQQQVIPGQEALQEFHKNLKIIVDSVFGFLEGIEAALVANTVSSNIIDIAINSAKNTIALPIIREAVKGKASSVQLLSYVEAVIQLLEITKLINTIFFIVGILFLLYSVAMCLWLTTSGCKTKGTGPCVCRFPICLLITWWLIGALTIPIALALADICVDPVSTVASIVNTAYPTISKELVHYYLGCVEPNPIQGTIDVIHGVIVYILGPVASAVVYMAGDFDSIKGPVKAARDYFDVMIAEKQCTWSSEATRDAFAKLCTTLIMGITLIALSSAFIAMFLTIAVMSCIKLRNFHGWPESKTRKYPCPSTCKVHKLFDKDIPPCPPIPREPSIELPKPKPFLHRGTCPATCRGYSEDLAMPNPRETCPKECKGMKQWIDPACPKPAKIQPVKKYKKLEYKKKVNKAAKCCIELPEDIQCIPEGRTLSHWNKRKRKRKVKPCDDTTCRTGAAPAKDPVKNPVKAPVEAENQQLGQQSEGQRAECGPPPGRPCKFKGRAITNWRRK